MKEILLVNDLPIEVEFTMFEIESLFVPLLKRLEKMHLETDKRVICILAAPPGSGKTTTSLFLERLSKSVLSTATFQSVSLDGFHYPQNYLVDHCIESNGKKIKLAAIKGAPETFNTKELVNKMESLKTGEVDWPIYNRRLHDVGTEGVKITGDIVLIEGNWLLLDEEPWGKIKQLSHYSVRIHAKKEQLKERLIERKIKGGSAREEAEEFYYQSDQKNIERVETHSLRADEQWMLDEKGHLQRLTQ
ncbi:nucleoside/nucleotide kinase family protein [Lacticigenium naphthae]|uniref:nucleoside/nucleotide kinase family protein n=1 Tax=Lacticigenium naphthae TaxID=515351 RepID=UPI000425C1D5|nr:nucleoside/nucleotide kinase family protein [Lacticigenium naphthae]